MAVFDLKAAARVASTGGDFPTAVGTAFGVPQCMIGLAQDVLSILPGSVLGGVAQDLLAGRDAADSVMQSINNFLRETLGIIQWDTENGGFIFISASSKNGYDRFGGNFLSDALGFLNAATAFAGKLYQNYETTVNQINGIRDCFKTYTDYLKYKNGNSGNALAGLTDEQYNNYINDLYAVEISQMQQARDFIVSADAQLGIINDILAARAQNPDLEPVFNCEAIQYLSGTRFEAQCLQTSSAPKEIFRLVYGPPKSTVGQFILSNDGIYFDSQSSGISPALTYISEKSKDLPSSRKWKFDYAPNLGGRGDSFSTEDLKFYLNTVLDPNIIDESTKLKEYYVKDGFLQELISNKNKRIYDLSAQITDLIVDAAPQSVIYNYKQSLVSENALHQQYINKRKKQIELSIKLPSIYSNLEPYKPGEVPVNDFSYLAGSNITLDIEKQKALSFSQVDIDSVVLPLQLSSPLTISRRVGTNSSVEHLIIPEVGDGAIIYDGSSVSATNAVILPVEHFITTDSLIAMYNFLDTTVEDPSSTSYQLRNSASKSNEGYAQLVSDSQSSVFRMGLGVPFLQGITKNSSAAPTEISGLGSYVRLPDYQELNDLMYNARGATIDFWAHIPNLQVIDGGFDINGVSSLYRLVLANENTGVQGTADSTEAKFNIFGDKVTRGLVLGFTRDRRISNSLSASNETDDNVDISFFLAPTQSVNASTVSFINRSYYDTNNCASTTAYHSMVCNITTEVNSKYFGLCENEFCHVAITLDPGTDTIKFYLDGINLATSSLSYVFGIDRGTMPRIPTFKKTNSFEYSASSVNSTAPNSLKFGPKLDRYFTPWIVGGGYTDGMHLYGNFMGGPYGGISSGLRGHVGSLKFYSKPLISGEIVNNYNAHKNFFKNINTVVLGWEEVISS
jgi:hypothetical protein